jgi:hypothetical protein
MEIEAKTIEILRRLSTEHMRVSGMPPSSIWLAAANDSNFFRRVSVESGPSFTVKKYATIIRWFSDNWPALAVWPDCVERPALSSTKSEAAE